MSIEESWGNFFKAEIKTSGRKLFVQEKVSVSGSDTSIQAFVRASQAFRVRLSAQDIASSTFTADCSCPVAKKSQFCKHVWATLLCVERKFPDFLSEKSSIEKPEPDAAPVVSAVIDSRVGAQAEERKEKQAEKQKAYQAEAKARAAAYRKEQYQKSKERLKARKLRSRAEHEPVMPTRVFPAEVEDGLAYFERNGFPMPAGPVESVISEAKRMLSRVFHPDKGGSNTEIVELNRYCELLLGFLRS